MPKGRKSYVAAEPKEKREYSGVPTAKPATAPAPAPDVVARIDRWAAAHDLPNGWRRELKEILKNSL